jgi:hypothetical protein
MIKRWTKIQKTLQQTGILPNKKDSWEVQLEKEMKRRKQHVQQRIKEYNASISQESQKEPELSPETIDMLKTIFKESSGQGDSILKPKHQISDFNNDFKFSKKSVVFRDTVSYYSLSESECESDDDEWEQDSINSEDEEWQASPSTVTDEEPLEYIPPLRSDNAVTPISLKTQTQHDITRTYTPPLERSSPISMQRSVTLPPRLSSKNIELPSPPRSTPSESSRSSTPTTLTDELPVIQLEKLPKLVIDTKQMVSYTPVSPDSPLPSPYFYEKKLPVPPTDSPVIPRKAASILDINNITIPTRTTSIRESPMLRNSPTSF